MSVAWNKGCAVSKEGVLGVRSLKANNKAMMSKLVWTILEGITPILSPLRAKLVNSDDSARTVYYKSSVWSSIREVFISLMAKKIWLVGEHSVVKFWSINWLGYIIMGRVENGIIDDHHALVSNFYLNGS